MTEIVLLRHGESIYNRDKMYSGWIDTDLSELGSAQAKNAGQILKKHDFVFDEVHVSVLKRAIRTMWITLEEMDLMWLPVYRTWRLNERHFGAMQGKDKDKAVDIFGKEVTRRSFHSYHVKPPVADTADATCLKFLGSGSREDLPFGGESMADASVRLLQYWRQTLVPAMKEGKRLLVVAHGDIFRILIKYLDNIGDEEIGWLPVPAASPIVYQFTDDFKVTQHYYLDEQQEDIRRRGVLRSDDEVS